MDLKWYHLDGEGYQWMSADGRREVESDSENDNSHYRSN